MIKKTNQLESGFTLLELMVALTVLIVALSIAFQAFSGTIRAWKRGTEILENIKHGEFAMMQLANALNSTIYFSDDKKSYGFTKDTETSSAGFPADILSWVTGSSAFMSKGSSFEHGPHRVKIFIDETDEGETALFASALPTLADEDEFEEEPILITKGIQGIECLIYDEENDEWIEEWEKESSIPERIQISLFAEPDDEDDEPVIFTRVIEIPVAQSVELNLPGPTRGGNQGQQGGSPNQGGPRVVR